MGEVLKSVQHLVRVVVEIHPCVPAGVVFIYLHHALQKHLSHRYVVLQPSGRKINLIDVVSFILARNSGQISMSSGSACVTAALYFGVESTSGPQPRPHCCTKVTGILLPSG